MYAIAILEAAIVTERKLTAALIIPDFLVGKGIIIYRESRLGLLVSFPECGATDDAAVRDLPCLGVAHDQNTPARVRTRLVLLETA